MIKNDNKSLYILTFLIIILGILVSVTGLLYTTGGKSFDFVNQYGDTVKIYGNGLYARDSYFMAPIFRGTDFTIICFAIPTLIVSLILDMKNKKLKNRLFLISVISLFTYYSASIAFGVTYNMLHLVYIALFSASFFGLIIGIKSIDSNQIAERMKDKLLGKGIYIFLVLTGVALIVAWLPDIINSLVLGRSLQLIEVYTTQVTYVLDIGIIAPVAFICLFQLKKRNGIGYVLLEVLLTVCNFIGIMIPIQTLFQLRVGILLPVEVVVTKVVTFVLLSILALYFNIKFFQNME
ncbi:hypothetical protein [Clostridium lundense]|uniref:hypothetical protein n=1 Tax=Clostridium lundense TaxID=319475 RepID=UPI000ADB9CD8|nr:hypothetical protein [Clostridium lundense]